MKQSSIIRKIFHPVSAVLMLSFISNSVHAGGENGTPPLNRYFYIKSVQAGTVNPGYWDQPGSPVKFNRGDNLALNAKDNNIDQQFRFISAGSGYYYIESKNGGIVDVESDKKDDGTNVLIWSGHGGSNQLFRFRHLGKGRWKIYAKNGSVVCTQQGFENGTNVHIRKEHDGPWTEWFLEDAVTGKIYNPSSQK